jgi:spermidine synthase
MNPPTGKHVPDEQRRVFVIVCLCFLLSGFAALLYETVWLRQFAVILGTSEQALAVVLGSYMGGLSFGAWIASRMAGRIRRPLLTYGLLEAGIAGCALAMPLGLSAVGWLQIQIFGGSPQPPSAGSLSMVCFGLLAAFGLILPATAMMGATLPLLAKYAVHHDRQLGPRIGFLYAVNTLGAVGGTLCAAFVCLPALGLERTTWVGAAVNLSVFALVWIGFKEQPIDALGHDLSAENQARDPRTLAASAQDSSSKASDLKDGPIPYEAILWFAAVSGAVSFCYEIVFTRMLGHMMGGSVFAFATMLAGFLLGIALGGAIAARVALRRYGAAT